MSCLIVDLPDTEARGRNGIFRAREARVYSFTAAHHVSIDVFSARSADLAPVMLKMPPAAAMAFAKAIAAAAYQVLAAQSDVVTLVAVAETIDSVGERCADLDEHVHALTDDATAAEIDNGGYGSQIPFLVEGLGKPAALRIVLEVLLAGSGLRPGRSVVAERTIAAIRDLLWSEGPDTVWDSDTIERVAEIVGIPKAASNCGG